MKILIIHGSPRKVNTYKVTSYIKSLIKQSYNAQFDNIFLKDIDLGHCLGCNKCFIQGESFCPKYKKVNSILSKIKEYDAVIISSPTYSLQVSSLLKSWIDHMSYHFHRPSLFTTKALIVTTTAGAGAKSIASYLETVLRFWGVSSIYKLPIKCFSFDYEFTKKDCKFINKITSKFSKDLSSNIIHPPPFKQVIIFNLWRAMAYKGKSAKTADYNYWVKTRLIERPYPNTVPVSKFKLKIGQLSYFLFIKLLSEPASSA